MYYQSIKKDKFTIKGLGEINISGTSRSAKRTGYLIEPFGIYCDAGIPSDIKPNIVLLSHGHHDHVASLYSILSESEDITPVMMSSSLNTSIKKMLNGFKSLDAGGSTVQFRNYKPINHTDYEITIKKKHIKIKTYELDHSISSIAFSISLITKKLKTEFQNKTGKELGLIKKQHNIYDDYPINMILFVSDTGKSILSTLPFSNHKIVIIECTFIEDDHYEDAIRKKHLHWKDLEPIINSNKETIFILGHFSVRYKDSYLIEKEKELQSKYTNMKFWI